MTTKDSLYDKAPAWTREQYDLMQEHAHELGYHLLTPYRKGLKNIRVGVIKEVVGEAPTHPEETIKK